jgi:hypothetical protein
VLFDFLTFAVAGAAFATVLLQILATRRVRRDISFAPEQRSRQLWLIWLLPLVGAAIVLAVLRDEPLVKPPADPPGRADA